MVSHIKNRHCDVKGVAEKQHSDTGFDKVTEKELASYFMHIVLIHDHCNQLIAEYRTDDHARYGYHHIFRKVLYHRKHSAVP